MATGTLKMASTLPQAKRRDLAHAVEVLFA
jgi:hypothetical protein